MFSKKKIYLLLEVVKTQDCVLSMGVDKGAAGAAFASPKYFRLLRHATPMKLVDAVWCRTIGRKQSGRNDYGRTKFSAENEK